MFGLCSLICVVSELSMIGEISSSSDSDLSSDSDSDEEQPSGTACH